MGSGGGLFFHSLVFQFLGLLVIGLDFAQRFHILVPPPCRARYRPTLRSSFLQGNCTALFVTAGDQARGQPRVFVACIVHAVSGVGLETSTGRSAPARALFKQSGIL